MIFFHSLVFTYNVLTIPFDNGANMKGSSILTPTLKYMTEITNIDANTHIRLMLGDAFFYAWNTFNSNSKLLSLGGDHTISIASIFAANEHCCKIRNQKLGILWCDAYADFNTMQTSVTKKI